MNKSPYQKFFPFLAHNEGNVYLDSAATSQKPKLVIDRVSSYLTKEVANPGRGNYARAEILDQKIEHIRQQVADFIGAPNKKNIIFTKGATESSNTLFRGLQEFLSDQDIVLLNPADHSSFVSPWEHGTANIYYYDNDLYSGEISLDSLNSQISNNTKVVLVSYCHNVFGLVNNIKAIREILPSDCLLMVDASQVVGHTQVDVQNIGADALIFSGHKMFATEGIGVLWLSQRLKEILHPVQYGGGENIFEPGTTPSTGIMSLGAAIEFINKIGTESIDQYIQNLSRYAVDQLSKIPSVEFLPGIAFMNQAPTTGIISFIVHGYQSEDVAYYLNENGICVRAGSHCSHKKNIIENSIRVSLHIYNCEKDIDNLCNVLQSLTQ